MRRSRIWRPQELVFLDERKRIVGFGRKLPGGLPSGIASPDTPSSIAWAGFVNLSFQSKSFLSYAVEGHGTGLVPVGKPTAVPPVRVVASRPGWRCASVLAVGRARKLDQEWVSSGRCASRFPTTKAMPRAGANTGTLTSAPFTRPPGNCLVLASAHGSSVEGLSEKLINADTNVTIASAPLVDRYPNWSFWSIALPPDAQHLQIIAEDRGRGLEQWLAISGPYFCK